MIDIRWLEMLASDRRVFNHPSAVFINREQHSVYRVLQVRFHDDPSTWHDVPIIEYTRPDIADK